MCNWMNEMLKQTPGWLNHIWFSDEAHFHLDGAVNNKTMCFGKKRSQKRLKGPKVTGLVAFNAKHSLLGPYWFEENGHTLAINCERYVAIVDQVYVNLTLKLTQRQFKLA